MAVKTNGLPYYSIAVPPNRPKDFRGAAPECNFAVAPRSKFLEWLEENNRNAKPIDKLIEEFLYSRYEDNRPSFAK